MAARAEDSDFLELFFRVVSAGKLSDINELYEKKLLEAQKGYERHSWPRDEEIETACRGDKFVSVMFRLVRQRSQLNRKATLAVYVDAWDTFKTFFSGLVGPDGFGKRPLPSRWLFDISSDFVHNFCKFDSERGLFASGEKPLDDGDGSTHASAAQRIWVYGEVVELLNRLIDGSNVVESIRKGSPLAGSLQDSAFFAMVNLCRLHAKEGKHAAALSAVDAVDLDSGDIRVLAHVFKSFVTLCFYAGFAHMMLGRYSKAQALFAAVLREYIRMQSPTFSTPSTESDAPPRKTDKMLALLAICNPMCPGQYLDVSVREKLRSVYGDNLARMTADPAAADFETLFDYGCLDFVSLTPADTPEALAARSKAEFLSAVQQRSKLLTLRSYLFAYTNVSIAKLATYCRVTPEETKAQLSLLVHSGLAKSTSVDASESGEAELEKMSGDVLHFTIDQETVFIDLAPPGPKSGGRFASQAAMLDRLWNSIGLKEW